MRTPNAKKKKNWNEQHLKFWEKGNWKIRRNQPDQHQGFEGK